MLKGRFAVLIIFLFHFPWSSHLLYSRSSPVEPMLLMFYNVENLFDIYDDPDTNDDEFLPGSPRRWNLRKYRAKINSIYKVISASGGWSPPGIVALCEIENRRVLEDLVYGTNLSKFNYEIIHEDSPDPRGIDVCLIYRKEIVDVIFWEYLIPDGYAPGSFSSRSVLYAKCIAGGDSIHLFVNHWPSRRGGVLAGEGLRRSIARMLRDKIDSLTLSDAQSKIIITGDFNAAPDDNVVREISDPYASGLSMVNLSVGIGKGQGTYRYRGTWEAIDQFIVSQSLLDSRSGIYTSGEYLRIFSPDFLLRKDPVYPGMSPYSAWRGYKFQGGFSDHLPVLLELRFREHCQPE